MDYTIIIVTTTRNIYASVVSNRTNWNYNFMNKQFVVSVCATNVHNMDSIAIRLSWYIWWKCLSSNSIDLNTSCWAVLQTSTIFFSLFSRININANNQYAGEYSRGNKKSQKIDRFWMWIRVSFAYANVFINYIFQSNYWTILEKCNFYCQSPFIGIRVQKGISSARGNIKVQTARPIHINNYLLVGSVIFKKLDGWILTSNLYVYSLWSIFSLHIKGLLWIASNTIHISKSNSFYSTTL